MPPLNTFQRSSVAIALSQAIALPLQANTITVDSASDTSASNICILRDAIEAANTNTPVAGCAAGSTASTNSPDTIELDASLSGQTITLGSSQLPSITTDITINGLGQADTTIDTGGRTRIFSIEGGNLTLRAITVTGGRPRDGSGGAISVTDSGRLTISNSTLSGNSTTFRNGGAIYAGDSSTVTIRNSRLSENEAANGGAIYAAGSSLTLMNNVLSDNRASGDRDNSRGGAIFTTDSSDLSLTNDTLSGNIANYSGGGIFIDNSSSLTLNDATLSSNSATFFGGGITIYNSSSLTLNNATLTGNSARIGGGIRANNSSFVTLTNSLLSENEAGSEGGAIHASDSSSITLTNSLLSENEADSEGGAIYASDSSSVTLIASTLSGNLVNGGGFTKGAGICASQSIVTLLNTTLSGNFSRRNGGGVYARSSTVSLLNSTLSGNSASYRGGGIFASSSTQISITNSTLTRNIGDSSGGGIFASTFSIDISNSILSGNISRQGAAITAANANNDNFVIKNSVLGSNINSLDKAFAIFDYTPDPSTNFIATSDRRNIPLNQIVEPLADNGGDTQTHALPIDSPAINNGETTLCPSTDQRGEARVNSCDIGAFESPFSIGAFEDFSLIESESFFVIPLKNGKSVIFNL